ncbi:DUF4239 domain-containing protein [Magnetospirillum sulfuroxidans]|uniref:DUF4239 domain-containing protein n=1 Tax=Magnetospirillum sulfuroxidans TaxID=611300 RepID=A0ABS5I7K4_9PROT|nr:DUF4239 domain-containing protein [Magnetospirillum sulfuroxidans]MBR9970404.1 DUF4239 domain-containing protein [Magnetospirillum sulfuroxidans]
MPAFLITYDHYLLAAIALFGTLGAAALLLWLAHYSRFASLIRGYRGLSPPFVNVIGVLFALTLAFLANDTWNAHDRAVSAVYHEAGGLRSILALATALPVAQRHLVDDTVKAYASSAAETEWPMLAHRQSSETTTLAMASLLEVLSRPEMALSLAQATHSEMLQQAIAVRDAREQRISLSQTHVNPLKWLGMAFLGLLTMISIAMVYVDQPKAEILAIALFAAAAAPTAAIVLIQGNPFQPPSAMSAAPLKALYQ